MRHRCKEVQYPVPVLRYTGCNIFTGRKDWTWEQDTVSVACVAQQET